MTQPLAGSQTPLGEPMTPASAWAQVQNPLVWNLNYWLNLYVIGIMRLQDRRVITARMDREQRNKMTYNMYLEFQSHWYQFKHTYEAGCFRYWEPMYPQNLEYQAYVRDLDRMLEFKEEKIGEYLRALTTMWENFRRMNSIDAANNTANLINRIRQGLQQEYLRDAEARYAEVSDRVS